MLAQTGLDEDVSTNFPLS
ncbi:hypothetical protein Goklo_012252 [Gossypium klotzschianum]|uniref:Uncharacterized protein n=1 Tax=Gossypium klotzschianum TaxID=34286 RepID=A0A7J8VBL2_9ROSI|nr:hypothetical protein [Gossypium klotzschianum]